MKLETQALFCSSSACQPILTIRPACGPSCGSQAAAATAEGQGTVQSFSPLTKEPKAQASHQATTLLITGYGTALAAGQRLQANLLSAHNSTMHTLWGPSNYPIAISCPSVQWSCSNFAKPNLLCTSDQERPAFINTVSINFIC